MNQRQRSGAEAGQICLKRNRLKSTWGPSEAGGSKEGIPRDFTGSVTLANPMESPVFTFMKEDIPTDASHPMCGVPSRAY